MKITFRTRCLAKNCLVTIQVSAVPKIVPEMCSQDAKQIRAADCKCLHVLVNFVSTWIGGLLSAQVSTRVRPRVPPTNVRCRHICHKIPNS